MMGYNSPFTAAVGGTILASQWNTYGRDNLNALWQYTAAGSMVYSASASALTELVKGAAYSHLVMNSAGTFPAWTAILAYCVVNRSSNLAVSGVTSLTWNAEIYDAPGWHSLVTNTNRITPGIAGTYIAIGNCVVSPGDLSSAKILLNNTTGLANSRSGVAGSGNTVYIPVISYPVEMTNTDYINMTFDNNGVAGNLTSESWLALLRIR